MTTLSLLKNKEEFGSLRVRSLFDRKSHRNPHHEWVSHESTKWSKGLADHNQEVIDMCLNFTSYMYSGCQQRERVLAINKMVIFAGFMDIALEMARKERSAPFMDQLIEKLLTILLTGRTDPEFALGGRLVDALEALDAFMDRMQMTFVRDSLRESFESHRIFYNEYWLQNRFVPYDQYYDLRRKESAWPLFVTLTEISAEYKPSELVLRYIPMDSLFTSTVRLCVAVEDYLTLKSKLADNVITTGVLSYAWSEKCTVQTALDAQYQLIKALETECQSLSNTIANTKSGAEFETPALMAYVNALMDISHGLYAAMVVIKKYEVNDGLIGCQKWDQLMRQLLENN